jgi:hypothetical protein
MSKTAAPAAGDRVPQAEHLLFSERRIHSGASAG